ncbi:MAG: TIR domain-containing protein [Lachnospiraceae bacterium]|nr:TIR domain-containing protein [Lachnospiraceae bacterium]
MANKYNAFISYRHAPEDIKIASEVQKSLERFKIPPAIQQKTGIRRFERIFRDKEELPITADLNDDIDEAIKNSDNLIVICSTRTSESIWVRKEIETFLKYHTKKEIFTVLVDGEPEDVIPDILQHDTITIKKADGTTETREALIEPLSCDYRIGIKKARKVELPRLAASLLGCSYDELVQRRRQYERRRNAIIGTVSTCAGLSIMAYLVWSLLQIRMNYDLAQQNYEMAQNNLALAQAHYETAQANYQESLRNQSEFLATVSGQLLEKDDKVNAVLLALAALPSEGDSRPVTTRAEYALTNALGCYLSPGAFGMEPIWKYSTSYKIEKYIVTQDMTKLIALDSYGDVTIWNLSDHSIYKVIPREGTEAHDFAINREGTIVIHYHEKLVAYDSKYENMLWSIDLDSDHMGYSDLKSVYMITEGEEVLYSGLTHAMVVDIGTGSVELDLDIESEFPTDDYSVYQPSISMVKASQDGRLIAVSLGSSYDSIRICVYDRDSSEWNEMADTFWYVYFMKFTSDNELVISYETDSSESMNFSIGAMEYLTDRIRTVGKFNPHSGKKEWDEQIPYTLSSGTSQILLCEFSDSGEKVPAAAVIFSNKLYVLGLKDGKVLSRNEMTGEHITSYMTTNGDGIVVVLKSGKYMFVSLSDDSVHIGSFDFFLNGVTDACAYYCEEEQDNHYLIKYADQNGIIEYDYEYYDDSYKAVEGVEDGETLCSSIVAGDKVLLFGDMMNLYCFDPSSGTIDWKKKIEGSSYASMRFVYAAPDGIVYLIYSGVLEGEDRMGDKLFALDISDGSMSRVENIPYCRSIDECCADNKIFMAITGDAEYPSGIYVYDCSSHTAEMLELQATEDTSFGHGELSVSPDGKKAVFIPYEYNYIPINAYIIDLETREYKTVSCISHSHAAWDMDSGKYAIGNVNYVVVYDYTDGEFLTIPRGDSDIVSLAFCEKGLITYSQMDNLSLYDLEGNMIGNTQLQGLGNPQYDSITITDLGDELLVRCDVYDSIINKEDFEIRTHIYGLMCYDNENGRFFVKTFAHLKGVPNFIYYDRLSVDELIEKGREYIGEVTLSEEMKNLYGIS